ncbi:hypothetical protein CK203_115635 [Vitis vinifera]|uniref:Uncharacterized protein n=1 Tax=Vitis vinifera TaxID=29760 RepID=A0A438CQX0_VITVI|nr:hypothetical protein CK203_115635 [Vitis vinifera]
MFSLNSSLIIIGLARSHLKCSYVSPLSIFMLKVMRLRISIDVTFTQNHPFFTYPHLEEESLSLNQDKADLSLPNPPNLSLTTPSIVIKSTPTEIDTSEPEDHGTISLFKEKIVEPCFNANPRT